MVQTSEQPSTPGEQRSPWQAAILGVLTLGLYAAYWLWVTSKEVDGFDESSSPAFSVARWAIPTAAVGGIGTVVTVSYMMQTGSLLSVGPVYLLFALAMFAGSIGMVAALWRVWRFVERHERALEAEPLSPGLLLAILGISYLLMVPFPLAGGYVLHRTQRGLNRVWRAAEEGYEPRPPQPAGSFDQGTDRDAEARPSSEGV